MRDLLRQRRWLGFLAFALGMLTLCLLLARWQWHRYEQRQAENVRLDAALSAPAAPIGEVIDPTPAGAPLTALDPALEWRAVTATGRFDPAGQVAVRQRTLNGRTGFWIVTPLVTGSGVVPVNRGWAPSGADAVAAPEVPAPPTGTTTVTGRLRAPEAARGSGAPPPGQVMSVGPATIVAADAQLATLPRYDAYIEMRSSEPPAAEGLVMLSEEPGHRGWNNLIYSVQWVLFGVVGVIGSWRLMRQENRRHGAGGSRAEADDDELAARPAD
jgi:cytochrome oxidase assembly protein ShyY1